MDSGRFVGPVLAQLMSLREHSLVLHAPSDELVRRLSAAGADYSVITANDVPLSGEASITTPEGAARLVEASLEAYGRIDSALIRAGNFAVNSLKEFKDSDFNSLKNNLDVSFFALRALTTYMVEQSKGCILLCTSAHASKPTPGFGPYAAVRAAENALMRAVALEVASSGVTVNAIGTNFMKFPEFRGGWKDEYEQELKLDVPRGAFGTMEELAEVCALLLEGKVRHFVGQFFSFSGGWA
jgi:NAD(P)-dependent dehydrogenase (short-subunit alcohol dehydrogenase family)